MFCVLAEQKYKNDSIRNKNKTNMILHVAVRVSCVLRFVFLKKVSFVGRFESYTVLC